MKKDYTLLSVIVPLCQEADNIYRLVSELDAVVSQLDRASEVILVDDGSTDNTWEIIESLSGRYPYVRGIRLSRNFGQDGALSAGLQECQGDLIVTLDGDLQHPPHLIPQMIELWKKSRCHLVEGLRTTYGTKVSGLYKFCSRVFYYLFYLLTGFYARDTVHYKLFDTTVLSVLRQTNDRDRVYRFFLLWAGFESKIIRFAYNDRMAGVSQWKPKKLIRLALVAFVDSSAFPLYLICAGWVLSVCVFIVSALAVLGGEEYSVSMRQEMLLLAVLFLCVIGIFGLAVVGVYIALLYAKVRNYPRFIIADSTQIAHPQNP